MKFKLIIYLGMTLFFLDIFTASSDQKLQLLISGLKNLLDQVDKKDEISSESGNLDVDGHTPLSLAIINGNFEIAALLIESGADVTWAQSEKTYSPYRSINIVGYNLLHWACAKNNSQEIIELLLQSNININSRSQSGMTPLMVAFRNGNEQIVRFLLSLGATLSIVDNEYNTCLHHLILGGKFIRLDRAWIKELINIRDVDGNTPLHLAVQYVDCFNNAIYIKLFINNGADINIVNNRNFKAIDLVQNDIVSALFEK